MATTRRSQTAKWLVLGGLLIALPLGGLVFFGVFGEHRFNTLPYYGPEGPLATRTPEARRVGDFLLTNQDGQPFTPDSLRGQVWLAAFYSTDAPHAASFTKQLLWPNFRYRDEADVRTVCFSLNPAHDTPEVLAGFTARMTRYNGAPGKWQFLSGPVAEVRRIMRESFMLVPDPADSANVATVWLVDGEGYLRGVYHAASENAIRDAVEDIALLLKERDEARYAARKAREKAVEAPPLPVLGPEGHTVPAFAFTGLDGREFSHRDVAGRIRVVDAFFTSCPTICPIMGSQLARLQALLDARGIGADDVVFLSHTVDPERDTPERLAAYAAKIGADTARWKFLTGPRDDLYEQAQRGYFLTALPSDSAAGGFFHSDSFVLVDRKGRLRGVYDGTATEEVDQLLSHIEQLLVEDDAQH
jgi:protein SCO1/2